MTLLSILYWLVLILGIIFGVISTQYGVAVRGIVEVVLFVIIGLKIFKTALE